MNMIQQEIVKELVGSIYTVDETFNAPEDRVFIKEWKRFSFSKGRFEEVIE